MTRRRFVFYVRLSQVTITLLAIWLLFKFDIWWLSKAIAHLGENP